MNKKEYDEVKKFGIYSRMLETGVVDITTEKDIKKGNLWLQIPFIPLNSILKEGKIPPQCNLNFCISKSLNVFFMLYDVFGDAYGKQSIYKDFIKDLKKEEEYTNLEKLESILMLIHTDMLDNLKKHEYYLIDTKNVKFMNFLINNHRERLNALLKYTKYENALNFMLQEGYLSNNSKVIKNSQIF